MILSIVVYTAMALSFFALSMHAINRDHGAKASTTRLSRILTWEPVTIILVFAVLMGARMGTGYDHTMYLHQYILYQKYGFFTREFEPLFTLITRLMSDAHIHFFFYFFLWALLQAIFITHACLHKKELLPWVWPNVILGPFLLYLMNTVREGVVACAFLAMLPLIANRRFWLYCALALVAAGIHKAAFLMIPFYFIGQIDIKPTNKHRNLMIAVLVAAILIGIKPYWLSWLLVIPHKLGLISEQYHHIVDPVLQGDFKFSNWGPTRLAILGLNFIAIYLYPKIRKKFDNDRILPVDYAFFMASCVMSYTSMNVHHLFLRPFDFFMMSKVLVYAYVILYLFLSRKWLAFAFYCMLNYSTTYIMIAKAVINPVKVNSQILYQFFFI
ncbi:MAG: EpsG family protein [Muribaculaceae bacterium]|nr:EpsG family protein [Muribaculaceae bacterium]